jgi:NAD(P)H dehydrogenase (quinone)
MQLLIGATGTVGRHVAAGLRGRKDVRILAHSTRSSDAARSLGFADVVRGDLGDPAALAAAFRDVERVFLLTPASPAQAEHEIKAIEAAEKAGAKRIVKISLLFVGDAPSIRLKKPHEIVEERLAQSKLSYVAIQPPAFIDNLLWQLDSLRNGQLIYPDAKGRVSYIDARDVADVAVGALDDDSVKGRLRITGPEALTYGDLAARVSKQLGRTITFVDPLPSAWRAGAIDSGMPEAVADTYLEAFDYYGTRPVFLSTEAIERVRPAGARRVDDFIRETLVPALQGS